MAPVRRRWALIACVVAAGVACSHALAAEPPPSDPLPSEPTPTAPPLAIAPGPVATVPSPTPTASPNLKPDLPPVQPKKVPAPAPKPAPVLKAAPAPKATPASRPASVRATGRPSNRTPVRAVTRPTSPVRERTTVYPRRSARPPTRSRALVPAKTKQHAKKKPKPKPAPAPFLGSKLSPNVRIAKPPVNPPVVPRRKARSNVLPPTMAPGAGAAPSGLKESLSGLRWLFFAILGTGVVFLTAVGSRRLFERRPSVASPVYLPPPTSPAPQPPVPRLADLRAARNVTSQGAALNGTSQATAAVNGTSQRTVSGSAEPVHSKRRCLIPGCGCRYADQEPAGHHSG
jgi:hypothetical protein